MLPPALFNAFIAEELCELKASRVGIRIGSNHFTHVAHGRALC